MHKGQFIFSQLIRFLPKRAFDCLVDKYDGNKWIKTFTCWNHLLVLVFAQLSNRESLRDLITSLAPYKTYYHHLGFGKSLSRSNLSKANEIREVKIFELYAQRIISIAREKRDGIKDFFLSNNVYAFDSSTISLCLSVFWWTKLHHGKSGVKMHTLYDVKTSVPAFVIITGADVHDSKVMDQIPYEENSFYVFDRAYMATIQLFAIAEAKAFFVVREKHRMVYEVTNDRDYNNPTTGIMSDQNIRFTGSKTKKQYPDELRRIVFYDKDDNRTFVFYTNNMEVKAEDIALLYKYRWSVELFFKWMKQHLRLKEFYGTTENAVKIQIYAAIIAYCLVATVEKEIAIEMTTYDVLRVLSTSLLVKMPLNELLIASDTELKEEKKTEQAKSNALQLKIPFEEW
ncbi:MAG: IS4 family transposase [Bacteroidaceae bacterium]|nr:IS4 family transposase [Bacteroidaceae bacterium]